MCDLLKFEIEKSFPEPINTSFNFWNWVCSMVIPCR
jgi:hypothetical protein